ncbi:hypothetical protein ABH944_008550 [Caballeronia udeis]|uniref:Uncharacterized protein n=1 Tax=Caballeronia udeis TaxID=1232866 RepID=A0ABW8N3N0_9BURK
MANPESTISFRRFKSKNSELSRLYWFHALNAEMGLLTAQTLVQTQRIAEQVTASFTATMMTLTVEEYKDVNDEMFNRTRLQLLLVCSANLESYLNDITFAYIASKGHTLSPVKLDEIGAALGSPILDVASVPRPLAYAEKLFEVDLGVLREQWTHFYKLRCVVAHSGGVMTARSKRELSSMATPPLNTHLGLTWDDLSKALDSAYKIVTAIDKKVRTIDVKKAELLRELTLVKKTGDLPLEKKLATFLYNQYGIKSPEKKFGKELFRSLYDETS